MIERLWLWIRERRLRKEAREALCAHDGTGRWCYDCAQRYNPW